MRFEKSCDQANRARLDLVLPGTSSRCPLLKIIAADYLLRRSRWADHSGVPVIDIIGSSYRAPGYLRIVAFNL